MRNNAHSANKTQTVSAFLAVYLIWGSTYMAIKVAIDSLPPFMMTAARFLVAGIGMYVVLRFMGVARPGWRHWLESAVVGVLLLTVGTGGIVLAEKWLPTGMVSLLVATVPVFVTVLEHLNKGLPSKRVFLGLVLGTAGIGMLVGPGAMFGHSSVNWFGLFAVLLASFAWAVGSVYSKRAKLPESMMLSTAMQMICGGLVLAAVSALLGEHHAVEIARISSMSILAFLYLTVFGSLIAYSAYVWLLKNVSPSKVATYAYVNPIIAVFLGWALAAEPVTLQTLMAAALILPAVWLLGTGGGKPKIVASVVPVAKDKPVLMRKAS